MTSTLDLRNALRLFYGGTEARALYYGGSLLWEKPDIGGEENYPQAVMADGPVLFAARDGGTQYEDVSGDDNHFVLGPTASFPGETQAGCAVIRSNGTFDGASTLSALPALAQSANDLTIEFWARTTQNAHAYMVNFYQGITGRQPSYFSGVSLRSGGHFQWSWGGDLFLLDSPVNINDGNWHHIVARRLGTEMSLWVDGVKVAETVLEDTGTYRASDPVHIGGLLLNVPQRYFNGDMAGVALYVTALSDERIAAHYAARDAAAPAES